MKKNLLLTAILASSLTACGGDSSGSSDSTSDSPSARSVSTVTSTQAFAANDACPNGGIDVAVGIDENGNGVLDTDEIDNTQSICHGTNGADGRDGTNGQDGASIISLIKVTEEPASEHCANGGARIDVGPDSNSSDTLDASEITDTDYLCNNTTTIAETFAECADNDVCSLSGRIEEDFTLTADKLWVITDDVIVGDGDRFLLSDVEVADVKNNGVTLTIEPGTKIKVNAETRLRITRGSKLMAEGTKEAPIRFSSWDPSTSWNGIVLEGFAPYYLDADQGPCSDGPAPCNIVESFSNQSLFGGDDAADSSGVMKYVTISGGAWPYGSNDTTRTGLALLATGYNTDISYVQIEDFIHGSLVRGGTVNLNHIVTRTDSIGLLFGHGYKGNTQYAIIDSQYLYGSTNSGLYVGFGRIYQYVSDTDVAVSNITFLNDSTDGDNNIDGNSGRAIAIYGSSSVVVNNSVIVGDHYTTCAGASGPDETHISNLTITNMSSTCDTFMESPTGVITETGQEYVEDLEIGTTGAYNSGSLSIVSDWNVVDNGSGFTFDNTDYQGAVAPSATIQNVWWQGWTIPGSMDEIAYQAD